MILRSGDPAVQQSQSDENPQKWRKEESEEKVVVVKRKGTEEGRGRDIPALSDKGMHIERGPSWCH